MSNRKQTLSSTQGMSFRRAAPKVPPVSIHTIFREGAKRLNQKMLLKLTGGVGVTEVEGNDVIHTSLYIYKEPNK